MLKLESLYLLFTLWAVKLQHWRNTGWFLRLIGAVSPSTEEVVDRHQSDRGGVALRGRGELLGEALLPPAARVRPDVQQPLDVLQAAVQGLQASPGLRQHPPTDGERRSVQETLTWAETL